MTKFWTLHPQWDHRYKKLPLSINMWLCIRNNIRHTHKQFYLYRMCYTFINTKLELENITQDHQLLYPGCDKTLMTFIKVKQASVISTAHCVLHGSLIIHSTLPRVPGTLDCQSPYIIPPCPSQTGEETAVKEGLEGKYIPWGVTGAEILRPDALTVANQF